MMIKGFISYYRLKKGIGFITAEDGTSYFFHISKMLDENAYQGSYVQFGQDTSSPLPNDKAVDIMTLPVRQDTYGLIKFHNLKEHFGVLFAAQGECSFTQVTNGTAFSVGTPVRFAVRNVTMPEGETKRIAYDITPLPASAAVRGVITGWDGTSGVFQSREGLEYPFTSDVVLEPADLKQDARAEAVITGEGVRFIRAILTEPSVISVARVVSLNVRQNYALVSGPGVPQAIIGNPPRTLHKGDYINGEFISNPRGFECVRHIVIPADRIVYGTVCDNGTKIRPINAQDYPPIDLPANATIGSHDCPWHPRDNETCECLLAAKGKIAIARQGHPFAAFTTFTAADLTALDELSTELHPESRYALCQSPAFHYDQQHPALWSYFLRIFERHHMETILGAPNRFISFTAPVPNGVIECIAFNLGLKDMKGRGLHAVFQTVEARPGRPNHVFLGIETYEDGAFITHAPQLPEACICAEGIDF